ncbi:MAG: P-loop NTPase [Gemmatimonadetes bacterium]|nr:Mrp/NBP35 family ATP-binding protein [Gemmatimonadota bacterium]NIQ58181.1 Mrp/NBP35 family ATP-binding protein [Gemmatimonadota bacterium]NIU78387.1 P-loop NTPase [Gammaproteobacteria bacterium]NIX47317.1 P-loop NTPase [Gemmatimonadota bacterium]NIY11692.1 P-loop NTPase [Gemmatimonadota bacterium]
MRRFRTYAEVESPGGDVPAQVEAQMERLARRLEPVRAVWLVASGKGGVGKSAVTANLAAALAARGLAVGALDADLNGPSLARMLGADRGALPADGRAIRPAAGAGGTRVMSMDLLLEAGDPVRWREPAAFGFVWQSALETGALREFLADVDWGHLDLLLLDLPPGTDKLLRTFQLIPEPAGVLLVTTPSEAARSVVHRSLRLTRELGPVRVGLVANMTGHVCSACGHHEPLFGTDAARTLARETGTDLWAEIPFSASLARDTDAGRPPTLDPTADDPAATAIRGLAGRVADTIPPHDRTEHPREKP